MSERVHVDSADAFEDGDRRMTMVDGTPVGVIYHDGHFYALENECPHQGGPVCSGQVNRKIVADRGEVGERTTERLSDDLTISCPWHGWEYDLETGVHIGNEDVALAAFEVEVDDGEVYVRA